MWVVIFIHTVWPVTLVGVVNVISVCVHSVTVTFNSGCGRMLLVGVVFSFSARLEMLKFPSDFNINSTYYVLEDTADDVMRNINDLINVSGQAQLSRATPDENASGEREVVLRRQRSLSEPSLAMEEDVAMETHALISCSSHPQSPLLGSKVTDMRPESVTSQSSAGTVNYCR